MSGLNVYHHELRHNEYAEFYLKYEADKVIADKDRQLRHSNYKRCLAMAKICENKLGTVVKPGWWDKWWRRWLELAEHYKEVK